MRSGWVNFYTGARWEGGYISGIRNHMCKSPKVPRNTHHRETEKPSGHREGTRNEARDRGKDQIQQLTDYVKKYSIPQYSGPFPPLSLLFLFS